MVVKIIVAIGEAVEPTSELDEQPFCDKTQELLKAGKVIAACNASIKNGVMDA